MATKAADPVVEIIHRDEEDVGRYRGKRRRGRSAKQKTKNELFPAHGLSITNAGRESTALACAP